MIVRSVLTALLAAGLVVLPAAAQELGSIRDMMSNGEITKDQAKAAMSARFDTIDVNHDGKLSKDEYVDAAIQRLFAMDSDHDGKISKAELRSSLREHFRR